MSVYDFPITASVSQPHPTPIKFTCSCGADVATQVNVTVVQCGKCGAAFAVAVTKIRSV